MDTPPPAPPGPYPRYVDTGINLTDPVYSGVYSDKQLHPPDLLSLLSRATEAKITHLIVLGTDLTSSRAALDLTSHSPILFTTAGVSPHNTGSLTSPDDDDDEMGPSSDNMASLRTLAASSYRVRALGPIGLDYTAQHNAETQLKYFKAQLDIAEEMGYLPLMLIVRGEGAFADFEAELFPRLMAGKLPKGGVVGSWTGTSKEMEACIAAGLYIGINGLSVETEQGLEVVKRMPLTRICVGSDGPGCELLPCSAGVKLLYADGQVTVAGWPPVSKQNWREDTWVKGRNEPGAVKILVEVIAKLQGETVETAAETIWNNSRNALKLPAVEQFEMRTITQPDGSTISARVRQPGPLYAKPYRAHLLEMLEEAAEATDAACQLNIKKALQLDGEGVEPTGRQCIAQGRLISMDEWTPDMGPAMPYGMLDMCPNVLVYNDQPRNHHKFTLNFMVRLIVRPGHQEVYAVMSATHDTGSDLFTIYERDLTFFDPSRTHPLHGFMSIQTANGWVRHRTTYIELRLLSQDETSSLGDWFRELAVIRPDVSATDEAGNPVIVNGHQVYEERRLTGRGWNKKYFLGQGPAAPILSIGTRRTYMANALPAN